MKYLLHYYGRIAVAALFFVCVGLPAHAQMVSESVPLGLGKVRVPNSGAIIQLDPDGTISTGGSFVIGAPSPPTVGRYRVQGVPGTIDITITNVVPCDAALMLDQFDANFNATNFNDLSAAGIIGQPFSGDEILLVGVRASYSNAVSYGACNSSFDLNIAVY